MTITGDHLFALIGLLVFVIIEAGAWKASKRAQAEQDERDARYILARLTASPPDPRLHEHPGCRCHVSFEPADVTAGLQAHALVRQVLDGIPGFDEYFNRKRKPFDPRQRREMP